MEKKLSEIIKSHLDIQKAQDDAAKIVRDRLDKYQRLQEVAEKKLKKLRAKEKYWVETFIRPLAEELQTYFPERHIDILGPFGLRSSVSIWLIREKEKDWRDASGEERSKLHEEYFAGDNIISVTIIPVDLEEGIFHYETGETKEKFREGTIGEINGMNNETKQIESIEQLVKLLKREQKDKRSVATVA